MILFQPDPKKEKQMNGQVTARIPVPTTGPNSHFRSISQMWLKSERERNLAPFVPATIIDGIEEDAEYDFLEFSLFEGSEYLSMQVEGYMVAGVTEIIPAMAVKVEIWVERIDKDTTRLNGIFYSGENKKLRVFHFEIPCN